MITIDHLLIQPNKTFARKPNHAVVLNFILCGYEKDDDWLCASNLINFTLRKYSREHAGHASCGKKKKKKQLSNHILCDDAKRKYC